MQILHQLCNESSIEVSQNLKAPKRNAFRTVLQPLFELEKEKGEEKEKGFANPVVVVGLLGALDLKIDDLKETSIGSRFLQSQGREARERVGVRASYSVSPRQDGPHGYWLGKRRGSDDLTRSKGTEGDRNGGRGSPAAIGGEGHRFRRKGSLGFKRGTKHSLVPARLGF